jgi:alpha-aminoadipate carrier protein LysW
MNANCAECGGSVPVADDALKGEIVSCPDCGTEFEVKEMGSTVQLVAAPKIEEDWGE